jgi:hypothetical protein
MIKVRLHLGFLPLLEKEERRMSPLGESHRSVVLEVAPW